MTTDDTPDRTTDAQARQPVVTVSDKARQMVLEVRASEPEPDTLALWLEVTGVNGPEYAYDMYFQPVDDARPGDVVQHHDDLTLVVPASSIDKVRGAVLDVSRDLMNPGMVITNPNPPPRPQGPSSPPISDRPPADLSGDVAQRVIQVLDYQINPSIAAHGGVAELVAVEEDVAFLRLGGGCVGCGLAKVTLSQGIEVAILDAVPEIRQVVDVTDHASGTNPYYEPAKK